WTPLNKINETKEVRIKQRIFYWSLFYASAREVKVIHFYSSYFSDPQIRNVTRDHTVKLARDLHSFTQFLCFLSTGNCGKTSRLEENPLV
ncbi:hypothetical protein, partial [Providencia stuartii]|uniref:hypothetical protein n=1 Tax=Providencia stuartii TaxID=588 RepID=UPI0040679C46